MIQIREERKMHLLKEIHQFFKDEYELDLGIIGQEAVLDFFLNNIGKTGYNTALDDAKKFYDKQRDNMESDYYVLYQSMD